MPEAVWIFSKYTERSRLTRSGLGRVGSHPGQNRARSGSGEAESIDESNEKEGSRREGWSGRSK